MGVVAIKGYVLTLSTPERACDEVNMILRYHGVSSTQARSECLKNVVKSGKSSSI